MVGYLFSSFGPGPGMLLMLVILLLTSIALKIKTSSLPEDNPQDKISLKTGIWLGITIFTLATIYLGCYLVLENSSLALTLLTQSFLHCIIKVGFVAYFIYKTPHLYNFVSFQLNLVNPVFNDLGTIIALFKLVVPNNNRIDVIV